MEEIDFMFIYEHKVRELENICLLKYELDRRGYKTKIVHIEDADALKAIRPIYHAKVVVTMACYQNSSIEWHTKNFVKFDKIIDMQWENIVYPKDEKDVNAFKNYTGVAKDVVRVSWGTMNQKRMLEVVCMDPKKDKLVGHVGMDYLRPEFRGYYPSKEELFSKHNLPLDNTTCLFISPYFSDDYPEKDLKNMCEWFGEGWGDYYRDCMNPSKKTILEWVEKICSERSDITFIYRPHPGEDTPSAMALAEKLPNFHVIGENSVRQWILVCDKIYTGNSSTFVEAFFAKKMCYLTFPVPVPDDYELAFIKDADKIVDFEDFKLSTDVNDNRRFPVSEQLIDEVYSIDWDKPSFLKWADMAEEVIADDYYLLTKEQLKEYYHPMSVFEIITKALYKNDAIYSWYMDMLEADTPKWKWLESKRAERRRLETIAQDNEKTSDEEIAGIVAKLAGLLDNADFRKKA